MSIDPGIRFLSELFANIAFIASVCGVLVVAALAIAVYSSVIMGRIKRDARLALAALARDGSPAERFATLKPSPVSDRVSRETQSLESLSGTTYRVPLTRNHESLDDLVHSYTDTRALDAWPNIFVGVGLLLTFLGLALSLWNASRGAASGDINIVKQSVTTLLEFSAVKFTTSLVALTCSIVLSIVLRFQRRRAYLALERVEKKLETTYPSLTLERAAAYQLEPAFREQERAATANALVQALVSAPQLQLSLQHVEDILEQSREQTGQLQAFNSNLAIQLGEALDSKLQPLMNSAIDRLEAALRDMGGSIGSTNQDALKTLLASFIEELRGAMKTDSGELQRNLADLARNLGQTSSELTDRMASVFSGVEATGERLSSILNDASAAFRTEMGRAQESVGSGLAEALAAMRTSAEHSSRQSEAMLEQLAAGASSFRSSVEGGASSFVGELDRGAKSIDVTVERLGGSVSLLATLIDRVSNFGDSTARITAERISQLQATLADLDSGFKRVNEASVPFGRAAEQVRSSIELLRVTESSIQARLGEFTSAATVMSRSSESLSSTISRDVTQLTEGLGGTTERLTSAISTLAGQSQEASASFAEAIRHTLAEYESRFANIDRELQAGLNTIVQQFTATYEEIRERVGAIDSQMAQSVNRLATFNETFGEHTEDLAANVEKLSLVVGGRR